MKCSSCGFDNVENAKFCINCGKRIDGKVLCPKCQSYITPDSLECPNCGYKIPHRHEEPALPKEVVDRKNLVYNGFRKGFAIASIVLFAFAILAVLFNFLPGFILGIVQNNFNSIAGPTVLTWYNMSVYFSYASPSEIAMMWVTSIGCAISCIAVVALVLIFSIKGIVGSVRGLSNGTNKINVMNLAVIYLTFVVGKALIDGCSFTYFIEGYHIAVSTYVSIDATFPVIFMIFSIMLFIAMFVIEMIFQTKKSHIVDRILFICMFIFMLIILGVYQNDYIRFETSSNQYATFSGNVITYFNAIMFNISNVEFTSSNIALFILTVFNFVFYLIQISIFGFGFVYFLIRAFSSKNVLRSYRVPIYASIFSSMIISSIMLPIGITSYFMQSNISKYVYLGNFLVSNFILMFILTGFAIASLAIYKTNNRREKLMKLTTVEKE